VAAGVTVVAPVPGSAAAAGRPDVPVHRVVQAEEVDRDAQPSGRQDRDESAAAVADQGHARPRLLVEASSNERAHMIDKAGHLKPPGARPVEVQFVVPGSIKVAVKLKDVAVAPVRRPPHSRVRPVHGRQNI